MAKIVTQDAQMMNEQLCQICRRCAPPFFCYPRKTDGGAHMCPPAVRGLMLRRPVTSQLKREHTMSAKNTLADASPKMPEPFVCEEDQGAQLPAGDMTKNTTKPRREMPRDGGTPSNPSTWTSSNTERRKSHSQSPQPLLKASLGSVCPGLLEHRVSGQVG